MIALDVTQDIQMATGNSKRITVFLISMVTSSVVLSQPYLQIDTHAWTINSTQANRTIQSKPNTIGVTVGYDMNSNVSVEAIYHAGTNGSDTTVNGATQTTPVNTKLNYFYAIAVKPKFALNDSITGFVRLAVGSGKSTSTAGQYSSSATGSRKVLGLGFDYDLGEKRYLTTSYNVSNKKNVGSATDIYFKSMSVGIGYRF
jgi:hypothetical protein